MVITVLTQCFTVFASKTLNCFKFIRIFWRHSMHFPRVLQESHLVSVCDLAHIIHGSWVLLCNWLRATLRCVHHGCSLTYGRMPLVTTISRPVLEPSRCYTIAVLMHGPCGAPCSGLLATGDGDPGCVAASRTARWDHWILWTMRCLLPCLAVHTDHEQPTDRPTGSQWRVSSQLLSLLALSCSPIIQPFRPAQHSILWSGVS